MSTRVRSSVSMIQVFPGHIIGFLESILSIKMLDLAIN